MSRYVHFLMGSFVLLLAGRAATAGEVTGPAVVQRAVEAAGGVKAVEQIDSFHVTGTYAIPAYGFEGTIELHYARPDQLLFVVEFPGFGTIRRGLSKGVGWSIDPQQGVRVLEGYEFDHLRVQALRGFSVLPGSEQLRASTAAEQVDFAGRRCYKVKMAAKQIAFSWVDYYDAETGHLLGRMEQVQGPTGLLDMSGTASDYRRFGALTMATRWQHEAVGAERVAQYLEVQLNDVDPNVFALPKEVQELLEQRASQ